MQAEETITTPAGSIEHLRCLNCDEPFSLDELGAPGAANGAGAILDCRVCGARNEIRAEPQAGLGRQPRPVVARLLRVPGEPGDVD